MSGVSLEPPQIVFTKHADARLRERTELELDDARGEILEACREGRVEHRCRNIFYALCGERRYPFARERDGRLIVLTVMTPLLVAA